MIAPRQSTEFSQASTLVQSAMESLGSLPEVLSKADERMRKLWDDHCLLITRYAEANGRIADHQRLMQSYKDHFVALEALNGHQNAEIESLEAKNEALRAENEALRSENEALCAKNEELQEKIRAAGAILRVT
jgi:chromosome segregation ATPase